MVSYDDATSFGTLRTQLPVGIHWLWLKTAAKGQFIHDMGLAGFAMWETGGDSNNILLNAIRSGMGIIS